MDHVKSHPFDPVMSPLLKVFTSISPQHIGFFYLLFNTRVGHDSEYFADLIAVASFDRVTFIGFFSRQTHFDDLVFVRSFGMSVDFVDASLRSRPPSSSFYCISVGTSLILASPTMCTEEIVDAFVMDLVDECSFPHSLNTSAGADTSPAETLLIIRTWIWQNRHDRDLSLLKVQSLKSYILTHVQHSLSKCDITLFSTILILDIRPPDDWR